MKSLPLETQISTKERLLAAHQRVAFAGARLHHTTETDCSTIQIRNDFSNARVELHHAIDDLRAALDIIDAHILANEPDIIPPNQATS